MFKSEEDKRSRPCLGLVPHSWHSFRSLIGGEVRVWQQCIICSVSRTELDYTIRAGVEAS